MTPQFLAGIFSVMGAFLFFGAGFFFAKHQLSIDRNQLDQEFQAAREHDEITIEKSIQDNISLKRKLDIQLQKSQAYKKATQKRINELTEKLIHMDSIIGDYKGRLSDLAVEITRADSEKILINEALETTKKDLKDIEELEQKNHELTIQLKALKHQQQEIDLLQTDNEKLREQVKTFKVEKARGTAPSDSMPAKGVSDHKELGKNLENMVKQIAEIDGSKGVVVADKLGVLIAGTGDQIDKMAAMAAIYTEMDQRMASLIPLNEIDVVKFQDSGSLTLAIHPFTIDSENLILTTLTNGKGPDRDAITGMTEKVVSS